VEAEFTAYREEPDCELVTDDGGNPLDCVDSKRVDAYSPRTKTWRTLDNTHAVHREGAAVTSESAFCNRWTPTRSSFARPHIADARRARTAHSRPAVIGGEERSPATACDRAAAALSAS